MMKRALTVAAAVLVLGSVAAPAQAGSSYSVGWESPTCKPRAVHLTLVNDTDEPTEFRVHAVIAFRYTQLWKDRYRRPTVPAHSSVTVTFRPSKTDGYVYAKVRAGDEVLMEMNTDEASTAIGCDR